MVCIIQTQASDSYEISEGCEMILTETLNLHFDRADELIQKERLRSPENYFIEYLENYKEVVEILVLEDKSSYNQYLEKFDNRLDRMEEKEPTTPYYRAIRAEMLAQTGLLNVVNGDELSGFVKIVKANKLLKKNLKDYPDFYLNKKLYGVFNVGFGNIPPAVKWATNLLGLNGDIDQGFRYLNTYKDEVQGHSALFSESLIYHVFAYQIDGDDKGADEMFQRDYSPSRSTTLETYLYANVLDRNGKSEESLGLLNPLSEQTEENGVMFYPILLLTAKGKLNRLDHDADVLYLEYLENSKNDNYKKEACIKLSYHYQIHNQAEKSKYYRNLVESYDKALMQPDLEAAVDVKRSGPINVTLLKANFLVNGSYFAEADSLLALYNPDNEVNISNKIHYYMLKGKVLSANGGYGEAMANYDLAINQGSEISEQYAAEAALMAGNLAYKNKNYSAAEHYYKTSTGIDCENNIYRDRIRKKAKTQLRKLKDISTKS
jgi:hypothetical protein